MTDIISADQPTTREFPSHTVAVADRLVGPWIDVPDLFCDFARFVAGPELDQASLSWQYGFKRPIGGAAVGYYYPRDLAGLYVRILIEGLPESSAWFGVIEDDVRTPEGAREPGFPSGRQNLSAFGFGRLLERVQIAHSSLGETADDFLLIDRGLTFNDDSVAFGPRGNRATNPFLERYHFSLSRRGGELWTVEDAVTYIWTGSTPILKGFTDYDDIDFVVEAPEGLLSRPLPPTPTDRRTIKEVLDDMLSRRRGIGYRIRFDPDDLAMKLECFSFADQIVLASDDAVLIPANEDVYDLNFENALDVQARILYQWGNEADEVIVEGEPVTSTVTLDFDDEIAAGWTEEEETDYLEAASNESGYDALALDEQYRRNEAWRKEDRLRNVFRYFEIPADWDQRAATYDSTDEYFAFPVDDDSRLYEDGVTDDGKELWNQGIRILPRLPLKVRQDYSGTKIEDDTFTDPAVVDAEFLPPLIIANVPTDTVLPYQLVDKLPTNEDDQPRGWSCSVRVSNHDPAIELVVTDGRQQMLALTDFAGAAGDTDPEHDPAEQRGLDWQNFLATICIQGDYRVSATKVIREPPDRPSRTVTIYVPEMRLDYVAPQTVVNVIDGQLVRSTSGGYVQDDRAKLQQIADLAAEWYGRQRASLTLSFRTVDSTFRVGQLIRSIGEVYDVPDRPVDASLFDQLQNDESNPPLTRPINSPVTLVEWDFQGARQTVETAYAELDFV